MRISKSNQLEQKALHFIKRYSALDAEGLDAYNRDYFHRYAEKLQYQAYMACHLLEIADSHRTFKRVIDLGGGIGFQTAFLASLNRDWEVFYLDADLASCRAAEQLNKQLGLEGVTYYQGELNDLIEIIDKDCLILSRDVIEHIYDLQGFFRLSARAGLNIHNTAAVKDSMLRNAEFERIHKVAELLGNTSEAIKARDHASSYFRLREEIIQAANPNLTAEKVKALAELTRGLAKTDILKFLEQESYPDKHLELLGTNTCDPYTGNWAERLLSRSQYEQLAGDLKLQFYYPKYNALDNKGMRKMMLQILNIFAQSGIHQIQPSFSIVY